MSVGVERAPIHSLEGGMPTSYAGKVSMSAFMQIMSHGQWIDAYLDLGGYEPFRADVTAIEARRDHLELGKTLAYCHSRDVNQIGKLLVSTVDDIEAEFRGQTVLDIGCGIGRAGEALRRKAKARVTFLDKDEAVLQNIAVKSGCSKIVADGTALPFEDESFSRTLNLFSAIPWAETPRDTVQAFNEALRVTEVGGSSFVIPAFSSLTVKRKVENESDQAVALMVLDKTIENYVLSFKVWGLQDHVLLNAMLNLAEAGYCSITWKGVRTPDPNDFEHYSAILDVNKSIPPELLADNLAYVDQFMD